MYSQNLSDDEAAQSSTPRSTKHSPVARRGSSPTKRNVSPSDPDNETGGEDLLVSSQQIVDRYRTRSFKKSCDYKLKCLIRESSSPLLRERARWLFQGLLQTPEDDLPDPECLVSPRFSVSAIVRVSIGNANSYLTSLRTAKSSRICGRSARIQDSGTDEMVSFTFRVLAGPELTTSRAALELPLPNFRAYSQFRRGELDLDGYRR